MSGGPGAGAGAADVDEAGGRDVDAEDSTFYGDLFAHVVQWRDTMYLEDGLHRAVRAALAQRPVLHARVLVLED